MSFSHWTADGRILAPVEIPENLKKCINLWHKHDGTFAISTGAGFLPSSRWSDVSGGEWQKRWAVRSSPCLLDQLEGILLLQEIITELSDKLIVTSLFFSIPQCTYKHSLRDSIDYLIGIISQAMIFCPIFLFHPEFYAMSCHVTV